LLTSPRPLRVASSLHPCQSAVRRWWRLAPVASTSTNTGSATAPRAMRATQQMIRVPLHCPSIAASPRGAACQRQQLLHRQNRWLLLWSSFPSTRCMPPQRAQRVRSSTTENRAWLTGLAAWTSPDRRPCSIRWIQDAAEQRSAAAAPSPHACIAQQREHKAG
jgi:hypothetical protein